MGILLLYASMHGSTKGIAERVASRLGERGFEVDLGAVPEERDGNAGDAGMAAKIESADAVVVGSAMQNRLWLPEAAVLVDRHARLLAARPVWLFTVSSIGEEGSCFSPRVTAVWRRMLRETEQIADFRENIVFRDHHHFTGAISEETVRKEWSRFGRLFFWIMRGRYGDHREWDAIDAWAGTIADELGASL